ncbi:autotransporter assembly complex protein TamA [Stenoxybacter acetivorans]|uniref:autotransporter assembly complex protein TamA n=1 Tax=Stenoxybacter acetivorans TaxID=422441 RepID=UPI00068C1384|nr:autotransporter assembly complex family protein [Stenoxybacter acetivorans]
MKKHLRWILTLTAVGGLCTPPAWANETASPQADANQDKAGQDKVNGGDANDDGDSEKSEKPGFWQRLFPKQETPPPELEPKYPITVSADDEKLRTLITEHLPLITQQRKEELDTEQIAFLAEDAPEQVQTMLETEGYFNSKVTVQAENGGYVVRIEPGVRTEINNIDVAILGDILDDDDLPQYYKTAMENWALPVGDPFTQSNWSKSKTSVLSAVVKKKYPLAKVTASQARIDPAVNQADLSLHIDSKQPIYFGKIEVSGIQRYPEDVVLGMARFQPGMPYDLDQLLDFQQNLEQDSHYSSATVQADFQQMEQNHVPVKVNVSESRRQKFELGLRYDSEDGPGIRMGYDHYNVFNRGYIASTLWDYDKYQTTLAVGLSQPRQSNGYYWTSNLAYQRSTNQNLEKDAISSGLWYVRDKNNIDARFGVEYIGESSRITDGPDFGHSNATMLTASWKRQSIETVLRPANGYYVEAKIGSTLGKVLSSTAIQRATLRSGYYYTPEEKKYGTWVLRGQLGYVRAKDDAQVPSSLMFRTGGATSVRGYETDSIGIPGYNNSVLPDRVLAVVGAEYQYPISSSWALALFHDAGSVSSTFNTMRWEQGTGLGVRWFSPMAPFSFDIAYGHEDKKVRWHISLGTQF